MSHAEGTNPNQPPAMVGQHGKEPHGWAGLQTDFYTSDVQSEMPYSLWYDTTVPSSVAALFLDETEPVEYTQLPLPVTTQDASVPLYGTLQSFQQPFPQSASLTNFSHMQAPQVVDNMPLFQCSLSEEEILHMETRRREMSKTQHPTPFIQQEDTAEMAGGSACASLLTFERPDTSIAGYNEHHDTRYASMAPASIHSSNIYDANLLASFVTPPTLSGAYSGYRDTTNTDMVPIFINSSNMYNYNTVAPHPNSIQPLEPGNGQWPILYTGISSVPRSNLNAHPLPGSGSIHQPNMVLTALHPFPNELNLVLDAQHHVEAGYMASSASTIIAPSHIIQSDHPHSDMTAVDETLFPSQDLNPTNQLYHNSNTRQPHIPSEPYVAVLDTVQLRESQPRARPIPSQAGITMILADRKRARTPGEDNNPLVIEMYRDPHTKPKKKPRNFNGKAASGSACFACFLTHVSCNHHNYDDNMYRDILQRYSNHTAVPKFTCSIRTKLSDLKDKLLPTLVSPGQLMQPNDLRLCCSDVLRLLDPVRKIIDTIEPWHMRQIWKSDHHFLLCLSYGSSIVRWRKGIICLQPSLEYNLNVIETFYRACVDQALGFVDAESTYKDKKVAAYLLNLIHDAILNSKFRHPMGDESMANHCLAALEVRISHLYRLLLLNNASTKKEKRKHRDLASNLALFGGTARLLPPEYQNCRPILNDAVVLWIQKQEPLTKLDMSFPKPRKVCGPSTAPFPLLSQYVTPGFLAIFGFEDKFFYHRHPNMPDATFRLCMMVEEMLSKVEVFADEGFAQVCLALFPHVLSMVVQQFLGRLGALDSLPICANLS